jgi:hypothetical protein
MFFRRAQPREVPEHKATGEIERVYHEIRQTLRVSGVPLVFRLWAAEGSLLPEFWEALRPNAETRRFEDGADRLRSEAVALADRLGRLKALQKVRLGESQAYHAKAALDAYHYVDSKVLLILSSAALSLEGATIGRPTSALVGADRIERGVPPRMCALEMVEEEPNHRAAGDLFAEIRAAFALSVVPAEYRALALWPRYLAAAWQALKPLRERDEYREAALWLRQRSRELARSLPHPVPLTRRRVQEIGGNAAGVAEKSSAYEHLLAPLLLDVALLELDWQPPLAAAASPFPAGPRPHSGGLAGATG